MKKVSVIVAIYNIKDYIEECVESLLNQNYDNIEIILVDDGSTDGSSEICDKYKKNSNNIRVLHKNNGGLSDARNKGIIEATGEYLMFVDGDDWIEKDTIKTLVWLVEEHEADMSTIIKKDHKDLTGEVLIGDGKRMILHMLNTSCFEAWGKLFKKTLFNDIRFPEGKIHEDLYTIPSIVLKCKKVVVYHKGLYCYRQREGSIMEEVMKGDFYDLVECCIDGINRCNLLSNDNEFVQDMQKWYLYHILWYYYNAICNLEKEQYKKAAANISFFYRITIKKYVYNPKVKLRDKVRFLKLSLLY